MIEIKIVKPIGQEGLPYSGMWTRRQDDRPKPTYGVEGLRAAGAYPAACDDGQHHGAMCCDRRAGCRLLAGNKFVSVRAMRAKSTNLQD
jgi:hypothetical protein